MADVYKGTPLDQKRHSIRPALERKSAGDSGFAHARHRLKLLEHPSQVANNAGPVGILFGRHRKLHGDDVRCVEARIDLLQAVKAVDQKSGAGEQNKRHGNLSHHQGISNMCSAHAGCRSAAAFLERTHQIGPCAMKRGNDAKRNSCEDDDNGGKEQHRTTELNICFGGKK